jgi:hypothetical protein
MALKGVRPALILKRASVSRSFGKWNDDDFDVLAERAVAGRIFKANAAPVGTPLMWTLAFGHAPRGSHAHARLCRDPEAPNGGIRQELAGLSLLNFGQPRGRGAGDLGVARRDGGTRALPGT